MCLLCGATTGTRRVTRRSGEALQGRSGEALQEKPGPLEKAIAPSR
jgi:hypothetical protein